MQYRDEPVLSFRPIDAKESKPQNVRRLIRLQTLISILTVSLLLMLGLLCFLIRPVRVRSVAMSPTYGAGSVVFVTREWGSPERGEIAAFTTPDGGGSEIYVRRVVAVEGNDVEIKGGRLYVNGLAESGSESDGERPDLPKTTVPAGYVFVLADNPGYDPSDSGTGLVDLRSILGVVRFAYRR